MKTRIILLLSLLQTTVLGALAQSSDTLWVSYDNRFKPFNSISIKGSDSVEVTVSAFKVYTNGSPSTRTYSTLFSNDEANLMFSKDRYLLKPQTYSGTDYQNDKATTGYNFAHHVESEHFAVFWDARYGNNPKNIKHPDNGSIANAYDVLAIAEKCWDSYVTDLGFVVPGTSTTDRLKIQLYIPYQSDWRADAAGDNGQDANGTWGFTGIGHFNPWAATARGGHTVAHEVGHTFQYLVSADLGTDAAQHYDGDGAGAEATTTDGGRAVPTGRHTRYSPTVSLPMANILSSILPNTISTSFTKTGAMPAAISTTGGLCSTDADSSD